MAFCRTYLLPPPSEILPCHLSVEEVTDRGKHGLSIMDCLYLRLGAANHDIVDDDVIWEMISDCTSSAPMYNDVFVDEVEEQERLSEEYDKQVEKMEIAALAIDPFIIHIHRKHPICQVEHIDELDDETIVLKVSHYTPKEYLNVKEQEYLQTYREEADPQAPTQGTLFC